MAEPVEGQGPRASALTRSQSAGVEGSSPSLSRTSSVFDGEKSSQDMLDDEVCGAVLHALPRVGVLLQGAQDCRDTVTKQGPARGAHAASRAGGGGALAAAPP